MPVGTFTGEALGIILRNWCSLRPDLSLFRTSITKVVVTTEGKQTYFPRRKQMNTAVEVDAEKELTKVNGALKSQSRPSASGSRWTGCGRRSRSSRAESRWQERCSTSGRRNLSPPRDQDMYCMDHRRGGALLFGFPIVVEMRGVTISAEADRVSPFLSQLPHQPPMDSSFREASTKRAISRPD